MMKTVLATISTAAFLATAAPAAAGTVTFNTTPAGAKAEGFVATGEPGIAWYGAVPGNLQVLTLSESNNSPALVAFDDTNGNYIKGVLASAASFIAFDFGNDDPAFVTAGDLARLQVFSGLTLISTVDIALTPDDLMNQTISYTGSSFDNFTFAFTNAAGNPFTGGGGANVGLIEVIDNVKFGAVPEAATWMMMIFGFGMAGAAMRYQRRSTKVSFA